jgi:hypothetical protein
MVRFKVEDANYNKIYPVGSIYMSINETNPSELFGGEWEQIEDRFLLACGTKHPNGEEDGSEDAIVVSHNHTQDAHTHSPTGSRKYVAIGNVNWAYASTRQAASSGSTYFPYSDKNTDGITEQNVTTSAQPYIYYKGESGTGKNMPPYLAVYVWVRIQ